MNSDASFPVWINSRGGMPKANEKHLDRVTSGEASGNTMGKFIALQISVAIATTLGVELP